MAEAVAAAAWQDLVASTPPPARQGSPAQVTARAQGAKRRLDFGEDEEEGDKSRFQSLQAALDGKAKCKNYVSDSEEDGEIEWVGIEELHAQAVREAKEEEAKKRMKQASLEEEEEESDDDGLPSLRSLLDGGKMQEGQAAKFFSTKLLDYVGEACELTGVVERSIGTRRYMFRTQQEIAARDFVREKLDDIQREWSRLYEGLVERLDMDMVDDYRREARDQEEAEEEARREQQEAARQN